jgi:hypothetical protein
MEIKKPYKERLDQTNNILFDQYVIDNELDSFIDKIQKK